MREYKVSIVDSLTGRGGATFYKNEVVSEDRLIPGTIAELLGYGYLVDVTPVVTVPAKPVQPTQQPKPESTLPEKTK